MKRRCAPRVPACAALCLLASAAPAAAAVRPGTGGPAPSARLAVASVQRLPARASVAGALAPAARLHVAVALAPRHAAALAALASAVSRPGSPDFHRYLTVAQFARRFWAGAPAAARVSRALARAGLSLGRLSRNGLSLSVSGPAAALSRAFATRLRHVTLAGGARAFTDTATPTLPATVARLVQGVSGLSSLPVSAPAGLRPDAPQLLPHSAASADALSSAGPAACPAAAQSGAYTAQQIASAYGLDGLWNEGDLGAGQTVALFELEPYSSADVAAYDSCYGIAPAVTETSVDGGAGCGTDTTQCGLEDELDIEDVAGLAPEAGIDVYEGPNTDAGLLATYGAIVQADRAKVISTSWGSCEADVETSTLHSESTLFQEAASQGQTVLAAAGDSGSDDCGTGTQAVDDPASQPYVTGVGGTTMTNWLDPGAETVWNDAAGAGGGGVSRRWMQPSWQSADAVAQSAIMCGARVSSCREVPDVSADADPDTGYAIEYGGNWGAVGGTSAAAPTWAGLVALADGSSYCAAPAGFLNASLYTLAPADFDDVTSGENGYGGVAGYPAQSGYDMASGLGAPVGSTLVPALCGAAAGVSVPEPTPDDPAAGGSPSTPTITTGPAPTLPTATSTTSSAPSSPGGAPPQRPTATVVRFAVVHGQTDRVGARVRVRVRARDSGRLPLRYAAAGLPRGLSIDRRTGVVSGIPRAAQTRRVSITATDSAGNARTVVIRWRVRPRG